MTRATEIEQYHQALAPSDREICELLADEIERALPEATGKIWHAHPVWFIDGNPIVGYSRLKDAVRLLFWSGQSFRNDGLTPEGTFQAAEVRYVDAEALALWLQESRDIQWDYEHIRTNRGLVKRTPF